MKSFVDDALYVNGCKRYLRHDLFPDIMWMSSGIMVVSWGKGEDRKIEKIREWEATVMSVRSPVLVSINELVKSVGVAFLRDV